MFFTLSLIWALRTDKRRSICDEVAGVQLAVVLGGLMMNEQIVAYPRGSGGRLSPGFQAEGTVMQKSRHFLTQ